MIIVILLILVIREITKTINSMGAFLISTTESIVGYRITRSIDLVFANVVVGANIFSEILASVTDIVGGRSSTFQHKLDDLYAHAKNDLMNKASSLGANAIVGFRLNVSELSAKGTQMFMLSAYGTAVKVSQVESGRYEQFEKLHQMKLYFEEGIITEEEYKYETEQIKQVNKNRVNEEIAELRAKEQYERGMSELLKQAQQEREKQAALERERKAREAAELEAYQKSALGAIDRLSTALREVLEAQQIQLNSKMPTPSSLYDKQEPSDFSLIKDSVILQEGENNFDVICTYLMKGEFSQACAYYLKSTGTNDYEQAADYVIGVYGIYEKLPEEKLINKIATIAVSACKDGDKSMARSLLELFVDGNSSVFDYLLSVI